MKSIFSTQNLQTFFLRKYWRLPRRGPPGPPPGPPGPPWPPSRRPPPGPPSRRPPPPPCPPSRASRGAAGTVGAAGAGAAGAAAGAGGAACGCFCSSDIPSYLSEMAPGLGSGAPNQTQSLPAARCSVHRRELPWPALTCWRRTARPARLPSNGGDAARRAVRASASASSGASNPRRAARSDT